MPLKEEKILEEIEEVVAKKIFVFQVRPEMKKQGVSMKNYLITMLVVASTLCFSAEADIELLISKEEIDARLNDVASKINQEYADKKLTLLMVMKGALCFTADLIRKIQLPCKVESIRASSYGYNGMEAGELTISGLSPSEIEGRDILVVDDIFETGRTILGIIEQLKSKNPSSIKTLLLLVKDIPRETPYRPDYVVFDIPSRFVIGYGLDYKELYRGLPGIYAFIDDKPPF
jgi:hypoxanthine phosphoribosyltransferase